MKNVKWLWLLLPIAIIAWLVFPLRCSNETVINSSPNSVVLKTKEKKGSFDTKNISHAEIKEKLFTTDKKSYVALVEKDTFKERIIRENIDLKAKFKKMSDSLQFQAYSEAIQLNDFCVPFEDASVKIDISGKARGKVLDLKALYIVKPMEVKADVKTYRLLIGGEASSNPDVTIFRYKGNIFYQSANGNLYNVSVGDHQYFGVGFAREVLRYTRVK